MQSKLLDPTIEEDFKTQAERLKEVLESYRISLKYSQVLEVLSKSNGFTNYKDRCLYMKSRYPKKANKNFGINSKEEVSTLEDIYREVKADIVFIIHTYDKDYFLPAIGYKISNLTEEDAFNYICKYIEKYKTRILKIGISSFSEGGVFDVLEGNFSYHVQSRNINLNPEARITFDDIVIAEAKYDTSMKIEEKISKDILSKRLIEYGRFPTDYTWGYKDGSSTYNTAMVILDESILDYDQTKEKFKKMTRDFADYFLIYYNQREEANISEAKVIDWVKEYRKKEYQK